MGVRDTSDPDVTADDTCTNSEEDRVNFARVQKPEEHHVLLHGGCEKLCRQLSERSCVMPPDAGDVEE